MNRISKTNTTMDMYMKIQLDYTITIDNVCTKVSTVKRMYTEVHNLSTVCERERARIIMGQSSDFHQFEPFVVNGKRNDLKTNQFQSLSKIKKI